MKNEIQNVAEATKNEELIVCDLNDMDDSVNKILIWA